LILLPACMKTSQEVKKEPQKKYYRIKQVDKDGTTSYSKIILVKQ
jgi:hypothetical protein